MLQEKAMSETQASKPYDLLVFIGRFRPFHKGHKHVVDRALELSHNVLVLVGSANRPRTRNIVWTADEVQQMVRAVYPFGGNGDRITIKPLDDWMHDNDFHWTMDVQRAVANEAERIAQWHGHVTPLRIGLIGHSKDKTSYYLKKFPQWQEASASAYTDFGKVVDATSIRMPLIEAGGDALDIVHKLKYMLPEESYEWLLNWMLDTKNRQVLQDLKQSWEFAREYDDEHQFRGKRTVENGVTVYQGKPYQPIHTTTDSTFIQSGHVLLGRRKFNPGKGLWALPGGFARRTEQLSNTSKRESKEETRIGLPGGVIDLAFKFRVPFTDVNRGDDRGRIITFNHVYLLGDRPELPEVQAGDDFDEVKWWQLGLLDSRFMYSDHFWQIQKVIGMLPVE